MGGDYAPSFDRRWGTHPPQVKVPQSRKNGGQYSSANYLSTRWVTDYDEDVPTRLQITFATFFASASIYLSKPKIMLMFFFHLFQYNYNVECRKNGKSIWCDRVIVCFCVSNVLSGFVLPVWPDYWSKDLIALEYLLLGHITGRAFITAVYSSCLHVKWMRFGRTWMEATAGVENRQTTKVNYGLFKGWRTKIPVRKKKTMQLYLTEEIERLSDCLMRRTACNPHLLRMRKQSKSWVIHIATPPVLARFGRSRDTPTMSWY